MSRFAVSAVGRDRPGIVAGLSEILLEMGGNIEDSKMSILRMSNGLLVLANPRIATPRGRRSPARAASRSPT